MMTISLSITRAIMLEEAEKHYIILVDQLVCEAVNENVAKQSAEAKPSLSLPALPLEEDGNKQVPTDQNEALPKDK
jgi:hypothetical protein